MHPKTTKLYAVITDIRRSFNLLKSVTEDLHAETGINPSMRAVMESLTEHTKATVPQIARTKNVSRQHIQVNMDALLERGLVEARDNPAHKRSPLYSLTEHGRHTFRQMQQRESLVLERMASELSGDMLESTHSGLVALIEKLTEQTRTGK